MSRLLGKPVAGFASLVLALGLTASHASARDGIIRADGQMVPVKTYAGSAGPCGPTAIISHGLGGSEGGLAGLGRALQQRGWTAIVMGHAESGPSVIRQAVFSGGFRNDLVAAATDPARHAARFMDLDPVFASVTRTCRPSKLILIGHSMGAATTMLEAGAVATFGRFGSDRFDTYVALSPQGVGVFWTATSWTGVRKPVLMITGTRDKGADGDYTTRLSAFQNMPAGPHRLAIIDSANHMQMSGGSDAMGQKIATLIADFLAGRKSRMPDVQVKDK
jgi:pimeloyl-ACP methyl ester carboxylesterase